MQYTNVKSRAINRVSSARRILRWITRALLPCAGLVLAQAAWADFEATGPDGRRYLLRDDGTWRSVESKDKVQAQPKAQPEADLLLQLEQKVERGNNCQLVFRLVNNSPYEIRHIVPFFSVYRANGVLHGTVSVGFQSIRPSDRLERAAEFTRIACSDIARVQVSGGDRCEMGDLHTFSEADGQCLSRVRVVPSDLIRFDK